MRVYVRYAQTELHRDGLSRPRSEVWLAGPFHSRVNILKLKGHSSWLKLTKNN